METAQNTAVYQAFKLANKPYELKYEGVYVLDIAKNSTFKNKLELSDTITAVNGEEFTTSVWSTSPIPIPVFPLEILIYFPVDLWKVFLVPDSGTKKESSNNYLGAKAAAKKLKTKMKMN